MRGSSQRPIEYRTRRTAASSVRSYGARERFGASQKPTASGRDQDGRLLLPVSGRSSLATLGVTAARSRMEPPDQRGRRAAASRPEATAGVRSSAVLLSDLIAALA